MITIGAATKELFPGIKKMYDEERDEELYVVLRLTLFNGKVTVTVWNDKITIYWCGSAFTIKITNGTIEERIVVALQEAMSKNTSLRVTVGEEVLSSRGQMEFQFEE